MIQVAVLNDCHEIYMVGTGPPWVNSTVFGNNRPNRTTDMGGNMPPKPVFCLSFTFLF